MKHLRKIIPICLLALVLVAAITLLTPQPQAATSGTCGTFLTWSLDSSGVLTISGTNTMYSFLSDSDVPWYDVRASIQAVVIEPGVASIGERAFKDCTSLQSVTIPDTVTTIGAYAFQGCSSLEGIHIPNSVTLIEQEAFDGCTELQTVTFGTGLARVCNWAFRGCENLRGVFITDIAAWCNIAFDNDYANPLFYARNLYLNGALMKELTIPEGVTSIGNSAFIWCANLQRITIPNSVTTIGKAAFWGCDDIRSVTLGNGITSIGNCVFRYCSWLQNIYYAGTQTQWNSISIGEDNAEITSANIHYSHIHDYTLIPITDVKPTCTEEGYREYTCVYGDTYRETYPSLGHDFNGTQTVVIHCTEQGYTVTQCTRCDATEKSNYTDAAGHDFSGAQTVVAPTCTQDGYTLTQCIRCDATEKSNPTNALGHNVVVIDLREPTCTELGISRVGTMCDRCQTVFVTPTYTPALGHSYVDGYCSVCAAIELLAQGTCGENLTWTLDFMGTLTISGTGPMYDWTYNQNSPWADKNASIKAVVIKSGVTTVGKYAFHFCLNLEEVTIADTVTTIGTNAFDTCSALQTVFFGNGITTIEEYAFFSCESLQSVPFPTSLVNIGDSAFAYCSGLQTVSIPNSVTRIDGAAFVHCTGLQSITLPNSLTTISESTFAWCSALQSVTIPVSVTAIDTSAFLNCNSLQDVYYQGNQAQWEAVAVNKDNDPLRNANIHFAAQETGDVDGSGEITNDDVILLMWHVLFPDDNPIYGNADFNGDNSVDNNDVILLMWHILFPEDNPL